MRTNIEHLVPFVKGRGKAVVGQYGYVRFAPKSRPFSGSPFMSGNDPKRTLPDVGKKMRFDPYFFLTNRMSPPS